MTDQEILELPEVLYLLLLDQEEEMFLAKMEYQTVLDDIMNLHISGLEPQAL